MAQDKFKLDSLLIKGGHVIDPGNRIDALMDVLLRDGRVAEVADGPQSVIVDEVHNGVPTRMAILARALGKAK